MITYWPVIMLAVIIIDLTLQEMTDRDCAEKSLIHHYKVNSTARSLYAVVHIFWLQPVGSCQNKTSDWPAAK